MIKLHKHNWKTILMNPQDYISDKQDIVIAEIIPSNNQNNHTLVMVGQNDEDGRYYIVLEDNDSSEDIYINNDETLLSKFSELYEYLTRKDDLLTILYTASINANVAPVFQTDDGKTLELTQPVINMINNILEQAYLPFLVDVIIDNGYQKTDNCESSEFGRQSHYGR